MAMSETVLIDDRGRIELPSDVRRALGVRPGDRLALSVHDGRLEVTPETNPFDALAEAAQSEFDAGLTTSIEEYARQRGISLSD
jgi:AbrB family looped-hinge helix DNA binding protein